MAKPDIKTFSFPTLSRLDSSSPLSLATLLIGSLTCNTVQAAGYEELEEILRKQRELIEQQKTSLDEQRRILQSQGREIDQLKSGLERQTATDRSLPPAEPTPAQRVADSPAKPAQTTQQQPKVASSQPALPDKPVGMAPPPIFKDAQVVESPRIDDAVGGVLTGNGKLVFEPSIEYSYTDNNRVFLDGFTFLPALAVGLIDLREIKRHSTIATISGRYGLTNRLEAELKLPYVYRSDQQRSRPVSIGVAEDDVFEADGDGLGDIQLAFRYQLNKGNNGWPVFIGNLVTSFDTGSSPFEVDFVQSTPGAVFPTELPTGSGYRSVQPGLSILYPTDPGVFFGSISYGWNEKTDEIISGIKSTVDPGDSIGFGFGMGFAFNERSSFSLGYSHKHVLESEIDGIEIEGSALDIGQLSVGYSFRATPKSSVNMSVTIGATEDAQDVGLSLRMPMTF